MKNILKIPSKIVIKISTLITITISLLINRHRLLFLQYLVAFIHEVFHCIGAFIFKLNVNKITFLPFGFYAEIDNLYCVKWYQELTIIILGPLSFFISLLFIKYLYLNSLISYVLYQEIYKVNFFILFFNLLPIYPLDGYRILKIIIELFLPEKSTLKLCNIFSLICTFVMFIYSFNHSQIFIISFLVINQYYVFFTFKKVYRDFLVSKTMNNNSEKYKIHYLEDLYRPFNNLIIKDSKIYNEQEYSVILLKKRK